MKGGLGLIPDDPSRIAPYDLRQSYMSLSWPWVRLLRVLAVSSFARRLHAAALQSNPARRWAGRVPRVGRAGWGYVVQLRNPTSRHVAPVSWPCGNGSFTSSTAVFLGAPPIHSLAARRASPSLGYESAQIFFLPYSRPSNAYSISISLVECQNPDQQGFGIGPRLKALADIFPEGFRLRDWPALC